MIKVTPAIGTCKKGEKLYPSLACQFEEESKGSKIWEKSRLETLYEYEKREVTCHELISCYREVYWEFIENLLRIWSLR